MGPRKKELLLVVGSCLLGTKYFVYLNVLEVIKKRGEEIFPSCKFYGFLFFSLKEKEILYEL